MENQQEKTVAGYLFTTEKDARLAEAERKKIEYLEMRIDYAKPETILRVYEKSIQERIFKTPVGLQYLKQQQDFLLAQEGVDPDSVMPIPLYGTNQILPETVSGGKLPAGRSRNQVFLHPWC